MKIDTKKLERFLNAANKHTYAADSGKVESTRVASEYLEYKEGDLIYRDSYFGNRSFIGEEIVYENDIPVWGLNYYGKITDKNFGSKAKIYRFLKKALMQDYEDILPLRGPSEFKEGDFQYTNEVLGDLNCFEGKEKIFNKDEEVYSAVYHGGSIERR